MTKRNLLEAAAVIGDAATDDGLWKVRLINEGVGSSGVYSADLLEKHKHAFDNVLSYINHTDDLGKRNFLEIAGAVEGETWTETAEDGTLGIYANWRPDEDHREKLTRYRDRLGLSISIAGGGEVREDGQFHVTSLDESDPFRSVDVVLAAGRGGRFEVTESLRKIYESRRSDSDEARTTAVQERKDNGMDDLEKVVAAVEALTAQVADLVADKKNAEAAKVQAEADATAVQEALSAFKAAVKAVDEADILDVQRESILAAAERGEDVAPLIESAVAVKAAAVEAVRVTESAPGREFGTGSTSKFGAWN